MEIKNRGEERIKKQQEKSRITGEIKGLEKSIREKSDRISDIKEKIKEDVSEKNELITEARHVEKNIEGLKNEKKTLFKIYEDSIGNKKKFDDEHKVKLDEWKRKHYTKLKEKSQIRKEVKQEYDNEIEGLENELEGMSPKERTEQEKWKKLELKAKYKLEEGEREKTIKDDLKNLQSEKRELEKEFNEKKQGLGKGVMGKDIIQEQNEINDHIREHENSIKELKKKIDAKDASLKRHENSIKRAEDEQENARETLRAKKKEEGSLSYIASIFRFNEKKPKDIEKKALEKEEELKEAEQRKIGEEQLRKEKELEKEKPKDVPIEAEVQEEVKKEEEKSLEKERIGKEKELEKVEEQKPEEKVDDKVSKMVEQTKKFAEGKEETAADIIEEVKEKELEEKKEEKVPSAHDLKKKKQSEEKPEGKEAKEKEQKEVEDLTKELLKKGTLRK